MRTIAQEEAERHMVDCPEAANLRHWSKTYSATPHLAGDLQHAEAIRDLWRSYGITTDLVQYDVLQNFPIKTALTLHSDGGAIAYEASLTEAKLDEDSTSSPENGYPAFHGFSADGEVHAELVYANFGTLADFQRLEAAGVSVRGRIALCKYGKVFRGLKVRAAEQFGAAGVVIYSDPQEDGALTAANGHAAYPDGPARHPTSVQRGSVDAFSVAVGDPSTPGYPSLPGGDTERRDPRQDPRRAIPGIPSLPISYADATPFLEALNGRGLSPEEVGGSQGDWRGALSGIEYRTGPSVSKVTLLNRGEYRYSPIYNVIGTIPGRVDEVVMLGSHHDSWCCGAVDPVSGSAAINEVARGLGELQKAGWKPYRKVLLASWDMEEYGLVGSTEFGEEYHKDLGGKCVAYINVDESTNGGEILGATGSPLLEDALLQVMHAIPSPLEDEKTVYDDWVNLIREEGGQEQSILAPMGTGSDYTVFFHHMGIPSLDLVFSKRGNAVYPYHSNYDSYHWIDKFGDPGFKKHLAMARLVGVLAVRLAGIPLLSYKAHDYANTIDRNIRELRSREIEGLDLDPLTTSHSNFSEATAELDELAHGCDVSRTGALVMSRALTGVSEVNKRYRSLEQSFIIKKEEGLPGRPWYKHMVFAPGLWAGYDGVVFPGILEALETGDMEAANTWAKKIAHGIDDASWAARGSH